MNTSFSLRVWLLLAIVIGSVTVIFTQTRMALLAGFLLFFIGTYYRNKKSFAPMFYVGIFLSLVAVTIALSGLYEKIANERFDAGQLVSKIHFNSPWSEYDFIEIEHSVETSSLITRMKLYSTSINMIAESPVFGIGSVRWNYHKSEYGFTENITLDTHNGYLAVLSQFGLISLSFIYLIYFLPLRFLQRTALHTDQNMYLVLISVGMAICDISNAGIYKHQIFALLAFNTIVILRSLNRKIEKA